MQDREFLVVIAVIVNRYSKTVIPVKGGFGAYTIISMPQNGIVRGWGFGEGAGPGQWV
jgi:hypothetical protein